MISYFMIFILSSIPAAFSPSQQGGFTVSETERLCAGYPDMPMKLFIVSDPDQYELLRLKARNLSREEIMSEIFTILSQRMLATVNDPVNTGVGIAAPQVGISARVIAVQRFDLPDAPFGVYVNPEIIEFRGEKIAGPEGCLSIPEKSENVARYHHITVSYNDPEDYSLKQEKIEGFTAVIFQHEIDHLDGILFTDRMEPDTTYPTSNL